MIGLGLAATRDIVVVPAPRARGRHGYAERARRPDRSRDRLRRVAERPLSARLPLLRLQRRRSRAHRVRGPDAASRGRQEDLHQFPLQPSPAAPSYQHADTLFPGADFPFSYPVTSDALTGRTDGLLARCLAAGNCPKIIKTDTELEFYQGRAALVADRHAGQCAHHAGQCPPVPALEPAACGAGEREVRDDAHLHVSVQSALCRPAVARAAHRDRWLDLARCAAARKPLSEPRRRHAGRADGGRRLSEDSRRHLFRAR